MRLGTNPVKLDPDLPPYGRHRVIMPVHIPSSSGYHTQSFEVLKLSLESLRRTMGRRAALTVVSNGSTPTVVDELKRGREQGWIDQVVVNRINRGKVDAVTAAARASYEPVVTITDSDVLFRTGWIDALESVFATFPECGYVSPCPNPALAWGTTSATVLGGLVRLELRRRKVVPDEDLDRFAKSLRDPDWFSREERVAQLIVQRRGVTACIGAGHFVFTVRREIVDQTPSGPALVAMGARLKKWLDHPVDQQGYWKLSTPRAFAYHMGNVVEPWMAEALADTGEPDTPKCVLTLPRLRRRVTGRLPWIVRRQLVKPIRRLYGRPRGRLRSTVATADSVR